MSITLLEISISVPHVQNGRSSWLSKGVRELQSIATLTASLRGWLGVRGQPGGAAGGVAQRAVGLPETSDVHNKEVKLVNLLSANEQQNRNHQ